MKPVFVFLHVDGDLTMPTLLVRSLRTAHEKAKIIQCSDHVTPTVEGVDETRRVAGDTRNLMTFRLASFATLDHNGPALYLDTDMLCVRSLDPETILDKSDVAVCRREFNCSQLLNPRFRGLDLSEYAGATLGNVYPFVACATVSAGGSFWADCLANLGTLDRKFHYWYGDQEAIRNVVTSGKYRTAFLPESIYGCLPEHSAEISPCLLHFKGQSRKPAMLAYARQMGIA